MAVPSAIRWAVYRRDGGCIAVQPDKVGKEHLAPDLCRNRLGWLHPWNDLFQMTLEHVRKWAAMGGPKAPDTVEYLVTLCHWHGVQGWELRHKTVSRTYLARLYPEVWADWLATRGSDATA
jgi:hypothetical protein